MDWQCLSVQTVYGYDITVIPPSSECKISAHDIYVFSENLTFLLMEATVCCKVCYESEAEAVQSKIIVQIAYT